MYISYAVKQVPPEHLKTGAASQAGTTDKAQDEHNFTFNFIHLFCIPASPSLSL